MELKDSQDIRPSTYRNSVMLTQSELQSLKNTMQKASQELKELYQKDKQQIKKVQKP